MKYVFDIDNTICYTIGSDYENSKPIKERIEKINILYNEGHTIIFQTARGMGRSHNNQLAAISMFYSLTLEQLTQWGVKFHGLYLGKPAGDIYIDDKGCKDEQFFR
jgi:capsule biosynthesis phosphatase